jgi:hypothetical protein
MRAYVAVRVAFSVPTTVICFEHRHALAGSGAPAATLLYDVRFEKRGEILESSVLEITVCAKQAEHPSIRAFAVN